jgi:rhamnose utilization protein RhaD (predicted bifunctional aldolase and dehydrogenase)
MDEQRVLHELVRMSRELARPENDYVILAEGNTSAKVDGNYFFVKGSGKYLIDADADTFVKVKLTEAVAILDKGDLTDEEIHDALLSVCADPRNKLKPSVETTVHSLLLSLLDINFVAHTHPTAVNSLLCSVNAQEIIKGRIFPDEIVYCGIEPVYIEYTDPGLQLGRVIRERVLKFIDRHNCNPKEILIQNHGIIAMGKTAHEVEAITAMAVKTCRVLAGASVFGGISYLTEANANRIYTRPDEHFRQQRFR